MREDLKPALQETQSTVNDLRDSWDDLYWDVKASVELDDGRRTRCRKASEVAGKAPRNWRMRRQKAARTFAGITADVHAGATAFVKARSTWQKIKSALWLVAYGAAHEIWRITMIGK